MFLFIIARFIKLFFLNILRILVSNSYKLRDQGKEVTGSSVEFLRLTAEKYKRREIFAPKNQFAATRVLRFVGSWSKDSCFRTSKTEKCGRSYRHFLGRRSEGEHLR